LWNHFIGQPKTDELVRYWYPNQKQRMFCMSRENSSKMIPEVIPGASQTPANRIEAPVAREVEVMPSHRTASVTLADAKQIRRQKQVCASIAGGRFGMLVREKSASNAFAEALDSALRA